MGLLLSTLAFGEESAGEIVRKSRDQVALNGVGLQEELRLTTVSRDGTKREEDLLCATRKINGTIRSLIRFRSPSKVAGVAVLVSFDPASDVSHMWLYLPSLKRVRQVAQPQKAQSFMETDFSYADLGGAGTNEAAQKRLPDQEVLGRPCFVVSGSSADSPYGEVTLAIDRQTYLPLKVDYRDKAAAPLKVYQVRQLKQLKDRTVAVESVMENVQSGSKTVLEVVRVDDCALGDDAFAERALDRKWE